MSHSLGNCLPSWHNVKNYKAQDLHSSSLAHSNPRRIAFLEYTWNYVYCILRAKRCPKPSPAPPSPLWDLLQTSSTCFSKASHYASIKCVMREEQNLWLFFPHLNLLIIHTMQLLYNPLVFYLEISPTFTAILIKMLKIKRVIGPGYYPILLGLHPESELYTWRSVTLELWLLSWPPASDGGV